ncbi:cyclic-di-AMP receptor [Vallitalea okinawensis]|uniref:cyclic-di-AMP receptor n=1 Tax=Vallitalea okinawensis TaxID=2078660 RepID=UPI000CFD5888|nr:cyclic-di-AMP receptor [Vallitalea okinawensis]
MKLVLAVIHDEDSAKLSHALSNNGFQTTKLASTGGFLKQGNTTMMVGVPKEKVDEVIDIIKEECTTRKQLTLDHHSGLPSGRVPYPVEVVVGGATVFVLDVDQFLKI